MANDGNWFKDISPPNVSALGTTMGYLDRLIGSTNQSKQFLKPATKQKPSPKCNNKRQNEKRGNNQKKVFYSHSKQAHSTDIDDAHWIEMRKKRFPRIGGDSRQAANTSGTVDDAVGDARADSEPINGQPFSSINLKRKEYSDNSNLQPRKRTLFEKLMI